MGNGEHRQARRVEINLRTHFSYKSRTILTTIVDISGLGLGVILTEAMDKGTIAFFSPEGGDDMVMVQVVWCKGIGNDQYRAGLKVV